MSAERSDAVAVADTVSEILYSIAGLLLIGFGLMGLVGAVAQATPAAPGSIAPSMLLFGISALLVAIGAVVTPGIRCRLDRRHSVREFGRVRAVTTTPRPRRTRWGASRGRSPTRTAATAEPPA